MSKKQKLWNVLGIIAWGGIVGYLLGNLIKALEG